MLTEIFVDAVFESCSRVFLKVTFTSRFLG